MHCLHVNSKEKQQCSFSNSKICRLCVTVLRHALTSYQQQSSTEWNIWLIKHIPSKEQYCLRLNVSNNKIRKRNIVGLFFKREKDLCFEFVYMQGLIRWQLVIDLTSSHGEST